MPFTLEQLEIPDLILLRPKIFFDNRGFFLEIFKNSDLENMGLKFNVVQDNLSYSRKGVLRGLHYQKRPKEQGKLVICLYGLIYDVAVDIRVKSPTFGKHVGVLLSGEEKTIFWIPPGFAHGFLVLSDEALVLYKVTENEYSPHHDAGIIWNDPDLKIKWPIGEPILSEKDKNLPRLRDLKEEDLL